MIEKLRSLFRFDAVRFAASSGVCFLIDYGIFTLLNAVVLLGLPDGGRELAAAAGARVVSAVVNFLLNRRMVFKDASDPRRSGVRYAALAAVQILISSGLVALLHRISGSTELMETVIKVPVDVLLFFLSYNIQKKWVFGGGSRGDDPGKP